MTMLIILSAIIVYLITLMIILYVFSKDDDFDTVGELCEWTFEHYPFAFIPILNTIVLVVSVVLYPFVYIAKKIAKIPLPKKKKLWRWN